MSRRRSAGCRGIMATAACRGGPVSRWQAGACNAAAAKGKSKRPTSAINMKGCGLLGELVPERAFSAHATRTCIAGVGAPLAHEQPARHTSLAQRRLPTCQPLWCEKCLRAPCLALPHRQSRASKVARTLASSADRPLVNRDAGDHVCARFGHSTQWKDAGAPTACVLCTCNMPLPHHTCC